MDWSGWCRDGGDHNVKAERESYTAVDEVGCDCGAGGVAVAADKELCDCGIAVFCCS